MAAIILLHSSAKVTLDPPPADPREQVVMPPPPTEEDWRRLDGVEAVRRLVAEHGADRVARWVRFVADLEGAE